MATVRISGNWRNPTRKEWLGAPEIGPDGRLDRSLDIPEEAYEKIEHAIAQGISEGAVTFPDGRRLNWMVS